MPQAVNVRTQLIKITWGSFASVILFWIFFSASKHQSFLSQVNIFIEDPFDAVGSFGVMLAGIAGLLAMVRLYRPYPKGQLPTSTASSIVRCNLTALISILVTLTIDGLALLRFTNRWINTQGGGILSGLTVGLLILAAYQFTRCLRFGKMLVSRPGRINLWVILICLACGTMLWVYPESCRSTIIGALLTALFGMVVLFVLSASIVRSIYLHPIEPSNDLLDDIKAIYELLELRARFFHNISSFADRLFKLPWIAKIIAWFNPRRRPWRIAIFAALLIGLALFIGEALGEGAPQSSNVILVLGAFIVIGAAGVITGFVLLNPYLDIIRIDREYSTPTQPFH